MEREPACNEVVVDTKRRCQSAAAVVIDTEGHGGDHTDDRNGRDDFAAAMSLEEDCAAAFLELGFGAPSDGHRDVMARVLHNIDGAHSEEGALPETDPVRDTSSGESGLDVAGDVLASQAAVGVTERCQIAPSTSWVVKKTGRAISIMPRAVYSAQLQTMLSMRMHPRAVFAQHIDNVFGCCLLESADVPAAQVGSLHALYSEFDGFCGAGQLAASGSTLFGIHRLKFGARSAGTHSSISIARFANGSSASCPPRTKVNFFTQLDTDSGRQGRMARPGLQAPATSEKLAGGSTTYPGLGLSRIQKRSGRWWSLTPSRRRTLAGSISRC